MSKQPATKARTRLIYWLLFAPFILVPVSVWILEGYGAISTVILWLGLGLEIASVVGFFIGLFLLSILPADAPIFRSKKHAWPVTLLFLIPLILLAISSLIFLPDVAEAGSLIVIELLLLRTIALASAAIGAILAFKRIRPMKTAWLMVSLAMIPYLLIIIVSFAIGSSNGFHDIQNMHEFEILRSVINLSAVILGLVILIVGWFGFRKKI